ncbi:MAG: NAD-dependent epimerase/dehydratase family protein [bacterium]|nr:NAD-dependent epimerase/dehydratase family protein [bacterium]
MKTIVTGGCGFIGQNLVKNILEHAAKDDEILVMDNLERHGLTPEVKQLLEHEQITFQQIDLSDREALFGLSEPVDRLYHIAALIGVERSTREPYRVLKTNTLSTLNIFEWFMENKNPGARLLYSSSSEVYSSAFAAGLQLPIPTPEKVPLVIDKIETPRYSYALSKTWGEALMNYLSTPEAIMVAVRYHNVYGPAMGYDHVIPQIIQRVEKREEPFKIIAADQTRSFCWVGDAVEATRQVMEAENTEPGMIVHIGDPEGELSIGEVYEEIFEICQWHPAEIKKEDAPPGSVARRCPDIALLHRLTGFTPVTPFKEGLRNTIEWYRACAE